VAVQVRQLLAQLVVLALHIPVAVAEVHRSARHKVTVVPVDRVLLLFVMLVREYILPAGLLIIIVVQEPPIGHMLLQHRRP
jgi:hypothetical protein